MGSSLGKQDRDHAEPTPVVKPNKGKATITLTEKDRTVLNLKLLSADMKKYQKGLDATCQVLLLRAKKLVESSNNNDQRALPLLKLRKFKLSQAEQLEKQLALIQKAIDEMEWADINKNIFTNIKESTQVLKMMNAQLPIEEVERILEESQNAIDMEQQISAAIGGLLPFDAELERELAALSNDVAPIASMFPAVPTMPILPLPIAKDRTIVVNEDTQKEEKEKAILA